MTVNCKCASIQFSRKWHWSNSVPPPPPPPFSLYFQHILDLTWFSKYIMVYFSGLWKSNCPPYCPVGCRCSHVSPGVSLALQTTCQSPRLWVSPLYVVHLCISDVLFKSKYTFIKSRLHCVEVGSCNKQCPKPITLRSFILYRDRYN